MNPDSEPVPIGTILKIKRVPGSKTHPVPREIQDGTEVEVRGHAKGYYFVRAGIETFAVHYSELTAVPGEDESLATNPIARYTAKPGELLRVKRLPGEQNFPVPDELPDGVIVRVVRVSVADYSVEYGGRLYTVPMVALEGLRAPS